MEIKIENTCIHRDKDGICMKCIESCPSRIKINQYNENNNIPCDMVKYTPQGDTE